VPGAEVVAVVAASRIAGGGTEVGVVRRRARDAIIVVAGCRPGAVLVAPPGRLVAEGEFGEGAVGVGVVAGGEDGAGDGVEQFGGGFVVVVGAAGDVAGADENGGGGPARLRRGEEGTDEEQGAEADPRAGARGPAGPEEVL
jgi:hypothetical protein